MLRARRSLLHNSNVCVGGQRRKDNAQKRNDPRTNNNNTSFVTKENKREKK